MYTPPSAWAPFHAVGTVGGRNELYTIGMMSPLAAAHYQWQPHITSSRQEKTSRRDVISVIIEGKCKRSCFRTFGKTSLLVCLMSRLQLLHSQKRALTQTPESSHNIGVVGSGCSPSFFFSRWRQWDGRVPPRKLENWS